VVHTAFEVADGAWWSTALRGSFGHYRPVGNAAEDAEIPRIISVRDEGGESYRYYRNLFDPDSVTRLPRADVRGARFVPNGPGIVSTLEIDGVRQIVRHLPGTDTPQTVSRDAGDKSLPYLWQDETLGTAVAVGNVDTREIGVYRQLEGTWQAVARLRPPTALPFIQYPRVFFRDGRAYVAVIAAETLTRGPSGGWLGLPGGDCEVWIMAVDPARPWYREVSDARKATRVDLEVHDLVDGPAVFYTEIDPAYQSLTLRRAKTGL
jgi:hypothetical protein